MSFHVQPMFRQQIALHSLQAEFMRDAYTNEWHELPGGESEGLRIPDFQSADLTMIGCFVQRPIPKRGKS